MSDFLVSKFILFANYECSTCLSMELYRMDTGEVICHAEAIKGSGSANKYDEAGYVAIPPCLWSADETSAEGLPPPVLLPLNATLLSIKRANATWPHTGEMASWQMRGVLVPRATKEDNQNKPLPQRLRSSVGVNEEREDV
jgi:hypothetical protein